MAGDTEAKVHDILDNLRSLDKTRELFSELNYDPAHDLLSRGGWSRAAADTLAEDPQVIASHDDFRIIYARLNSDRLLLGDERPVVNRLLQEHPYLLCLFSDSEQQQWHFVNIKYDEDVKRRRLFRRITVGPDERLRTATERLTLLDLGTIGADLSRLSPLAIQSRHDEAFDVEAVTKQFFDEYKAVFRLLEDDLCRQAKDSSWAHDYTLQFLNRCMFLYFIQRKGWLGNDKEFLRSFWKSYQSSGQTNDSFVDKWLKVLFFEAFNNKFHGGYNYFPQEINEAMHLAPYLNGGLFLEDKLDQDHKETSISDKSFEQVFKFLERYNFTIAEDSPLDKEVAVDPEMIGKVYESLVNVSEDVDKRGEAGIFYTPRTEIDLMCRLSLVDYLANHLGDERKNLLYQLVFALEPDEKVDADKAVAEAALWPRLNDCLREITVLDPACGSGSFLVGMLHILNDLEERANQQLGLQEDSYDRKKRIIGQSLYGVDVMDWACHIAELRLWLALIIDADFSPEELHIRQEPLLPHFSFKIRCGDSLVQEVGGINLGHIAASQEITTPLKARITSLKNEKLKFYNNDTTCKFHSVDALKNEERRLFQDILDARQHRIQERIKDLRRRLEGPQESQIRLDGTVTSRSHQMDLEASKYRQEIETFTAELAQTEASRKALSIAVEVPFVWDIAFVEIFESEKGGFDIVIGNPPYVRQESIAEPHIPHEEITAENKRIYKAKLAKSVYRAFPQFFGYKAAYDTVAHRINAKSDLYIYFYFHGLSLLNAKGAFCFISSNSWLDVGYGADLQEFLLRHCHVKMILDNQAKRSFSNADVNTVIALFSAPDEHREWALEKTARFAMFKVPFEHIISPVIFDEIEEASERRTTPEYRAFPIPQSLLLKDGCELKKDDEEQLESTAVPLIKFERYIGNKWGGKYLRAPDIYWTVLGKGKGKLVRLGDVAKVRRGFTTGANEFFYLDEARIREWGIEEEFLKPVIKSPRECKRILIDPNDLKFKIFKCHKDKRELKGTTVLEYIGWGESEGFQGRPTCSGRPRWWDLGERREAPVNVNYLVDRVMRFFVQECGLYASDDFQQIYPHGDLVWQLAASANSTVLQLSANVAGRANFGGGLMKIQTYEVADLLLIKPSLLEAETCRAILGDVERLECEDQDRRALDSIVFDVLGLTQGERDAVYEAVINLVEARLKKAGSV